MCFILENLTIYNDKPAAQQQTGYVLHIRIETFTTLTLKHEERQTLGWGCLQLP